MTLQPGTMLGRYQILEPLGSGGMATVYKAYELSLDRTVAVKVIRAGLAEEEGFLARFRREAQAVAKLSHPNIVHILTFDEIDGRYFLAMDYLEGGTLKDRIVQLPEGELLPLAEVTSIVSQVADALGYAHEQGIIHRDIKPSNIMLTRRGRAIVADFGIAKIVSGAAQLTQTGMGIGTPEYMAPEQGQGDQIDQRADIYSLGVVAYELLTGRVPFLADTPFAIVAAHMRDPLPPPRSINPALPAMAERALLTALAKQPAQRFASAAEFATALSDGLRGTPAVETMPTIAPVRGRTRPGKRDVPTGLPRRSRLRPVLIAVAAVALLVVAGTGALVAGEAAIRGPVATARPETARPTSTATAVATAKPPKFAIPPKGILLLDAVLDGPTADVPALQYISGIVKGADIRHGSGAIEFVVTEGGSRTSAPLGAFTSATTRSTYVLEYDASVIPGSQILVSWQLRQGNEGTYRLQLDTRQENLILSYENGRQSEQLAAPVPVSGLQTGRSFTVAVVVEDTRLTVYLDQRLVAQATATPRVSGKAPLVVELASAGTTGTGTVRVTGLRMYALP